MKKIIFKLFQPSLILFAAQFCIGFLTMFLVGVGHPGILFNLPLTEIYEPLYICLWVIVIIAINFLLGYIFGNKLHIGKNTDNIPSLEANAGFINGKAFCIIRFMLFPVIAAIVWFLSMWSMMFKIMSLGVIPLFYSLEFILSSTIPISIQVENFINIFGGYFIAFIPVLLFYLGALYRTNKKKNKFVKAAPIISFIAMLLILFGPVTYKSINDYCCATGAKSFPPLVEVMKIEINKNIDEEQLAEFVGMDIEWWKEWYQYPVMIQEPISNNLEKEAFEELFNITLPQIDFNESYYYISRGAIMDWSLEIGHIGELWPVEYLSEDIIIIYKVHK